MKKEMVKNDWSLTQESFDKLLAWLHPDREQAGERYEVIRRKLINYFLCRGCNLPEEFADVTINRVARKIEIKAEDYTADPALYFFAVARMVYRETLPLRKDAA